MNWSCSSNLIICILELAEGITHLLRKCRSSAPFSVTSNLSLFKSSPNSFSYARALAGSIPCVRYFWSWRRESNPQPADYKSAALPLSHASILYHILKMATWNGLEPSTSSVTGWHSNQLNYQAASMLSNLPNCCIAARSSLICVLKYTAVCSKLARLASRTNLLRICEWSL